MLIAAWVIVVVAMILFVGLIVHAVRELIESFRDKPYLFREVKEWLMYIGVVMSIMVVMGAIVYLRHYYGTREPGNSTEQIEERSDL